MATFSRITGLAAGLVVSAGLVIVGAASEVRAQAANPCAAKPANPCGPKAANPCAPKAANPCAPKSPADTRSSKPELDPKLILRPKGTKLFQADAKQLVQEGEALFKSTKLSTNGMSCQSCHHANANFAASFSKAYPHEVAMVEEKAGVAQVAFDEMIQFCMVLPMEAKPLRWNSRELAALTAYNAELQKAFRLQSPQPDAKRDERPAGKAANPCAPKR